MKVCVYGAGAIGGYLGAELSKTEGVEVSLIARGAHLAAMQANGLTVREPSGEWTVAVNATDDTASLGEQDIVILGLKAHTVSAALPKIKPLSRLKPRASARASGWIRTAKVKPGIWARSAAKP